MAFPVSCSTPFGIKDFCAGYHDNRPHVKIPVLNAFRHQRFLRSSRLVTLTVGLTRAQRLSASKISAPQDVPIRDFQVHIVLNAFRHQRFLRAASRGCPVGCWFWCSTPFGIKDFCADGEDVADCHFCRCSTPFGIKDFCATARRRYDGFSLKCSTPFGIKDFCAVSV